MCTILYLDKDDLDATELNNIFITYGIPWKLLLAHSQKDVIHLVEKYAGELDVFLFDLAALPTSQPDVHLLFTAIRSHAPLIPFVMVTPDHNETLQVLLPSISRKTLHHVTQFVAYITKICEQGHRRHGAIQTLVHSGEELMAYG